MLFLGDYITKFKDKITLKSKDAYVDNMLAMLGMESCKPTSTPMVRKESAANNDEEVLEGSEAETHRSVVGRLALRGKVPGNGEFLADQGSHETSETNASGIDSAPRTVDGNGGWCDGSWADLDEKRRSTTGGLLILGGACVAGWSRTEKSTALSSGKVNFTPQLFVRVSPCGLANFGRELGYTMTACLKEDASACMGTATRLGPGRLKHVEIKHFALQHWVRQGRLTLDKVTTTEQLADIMTKPFFIHDILNLGFENWLDEMWNRSLNLRIRANG